ncbi:ankyrin repeat-containing protein ITN1-like [Eucalyptus grandis]|uniref:ankyrin repeat-containing protein ITN1-like n=1 Tax=Eucalyptus grandis TaxID=71139 RepID=UPI00192E7C90|nr:ankyrin repeat-containing protein ITN1-like [Eucalyptus grandis]
MIKRIYEVKMRHKTSVELAKQVLTAMSQMKTTEIPDFFLEKGPRRNPLAQATAKGNSEIVKLCIQYFPKLFVNSPSWKSLITCAIEYRQERILNLFLKLSSTAELSLVLGPTWADSENMIKAAASYYPSFDAKTKVAGAAFRMQREIQWYEVVQSCIVPSMRTAYIGRSTDDRAESYWTRFVENHQNLLENGEKWIKDTSNSCMLVSTLIATVLFAAAFTIPGGNDNNTGVPLLLGQDSLLVFVISDSLGLFSSMTTILLFLAILTSRYEAQDFLYSLPNSIIMGLVFLFLSLAFMLVAFATTLTILLDKRLEWVLIPIILLTSIPVALFLVLQLPLLYQMIKSTYGRSIFRPERIW